MKTCNKCGETKPLAEFKSYQVRGGRKRDGELRTYYTGACKACVYRQERERIERERPDRRKINRKYFDEPSGLWLKRCPRCEQTKPLEQFKQSGGARTGRCLSCHAEETARYHREHYAERAERHRANAREYHRRHREERAEYGRRYYAAHREKILETCRTDEKRREQLRAAARKAYRKLTPEQKEARKETHRRASLNYFHKNRERFRENGRRWRRENPDKNCAKQNRRRALQMSAPRVEDVDRNAIIRRDNATCYLWCGRKLTPDEITLDHVIPLSRGGTHTADNLRVACRSCNSRKGPKLLSELGIEGAGAPATRAA